MAKAHNPENRSSFFADKPLLVSEQKVEHLTLDITALTAEGSGVARHEGLAIFVSGALPGERVRARITLRKPRYAQAELMFIENHSPERRDAPCPYYSECGGCAAQHMSYEAELGWKRQRVADAISRIGKVAPENYELRQIIAMDDPWNYRNKAEYSVGGPHDNPAVGVLREKSHTVINVERCLLQHPNADAAQRALLEWLKREGAQAHHSIMRLIVRVSDANETLVLMEAKNDDIPNVNSLVSLLRSRVEHLVSVAIKGSGAVKTIWGAKALEMKLEELKFSISPEAFFQVNTRQTPVLYRVARELAGLQGGERVLEAYCGVGALAQMVATQSLWAEGVDIDETAIADARLSACRNGLKNVKFHAEPFEKFIQEIPDDAPRYDVALLDPPRRGCAPEALDALIKAAPRRIVYISCDPATLARDVALLSSAYRLSVVVPVDMFPHTRHVECVALLTSR